MRAIAWRIALLLTLTASSRADDTGAWRAVVQQAAPAFLSASADGRLALSIDGDGQQVLHAVDVPAGRILLTVHLPESILGVALADGADRFAVGTEAGVYLGSLETGRVERVLTGAVGRVALSADGTRLGLLGTIQEPAPAFPNPQPSRMGPRVLGVYDLTRSAWLARTPTPIVTPGEVAFDGRTLVGAGRGGRVYDRRSFSFACDVRLEPDGRWIYRRGQEVERPEQDRSGYEQPAVLAALASRLKALPVGQRPVYTPHDFPGSMNAAAEPFAVAEGPGAVKVAVCAFLDARPQPSRRVAAVLALGRDRSIRLGPDVVVDAAAWAFDDRLLGLRRATVGEDVVDLEDGSVLRNIPAGARQTLGRGFFDGRAIHPVPAGPALPLRDRDGKPIATREFRPLVEGERPVAVGHDQPPGACLFRVYRLDTGLPVAEVPSPVTPALPGMTWGRVAINRSGTRFAWLDGDKLHVYDLASGRIVSSTTDRPRMLAHLAAWGERWILSDEAGGPTVVLDPSGGPPLKVDARPVLRARAFASPAGKRVLLEGPLYGAGYIALADAATGRLIGRWVGCARELSRAAPDGRAHAVPVACGRGIVANLGLRQGFDLLDVATNRPVVRIQIVSPDGVSYGWIATTPDGLWDGSPGAEALVAVVRGARVGDEAAKALQHRPDAIRGRIAAILGPSNR